MDRRQFLKKTGLITAYALSKLSRTGKMASALSIEDEKEDIESKIEKESYKWGDVGYIIYNGLMTEKERYLLMEFDASPEEISGYLSKLELDDKTEHHVFSFNKGGKRTGSLNTVIIEPLIKEIRDYENFISEFSSHECKGLDLMKKVYETFQKKIGGIESYNYNNKGIGLLGSSPIHPAVLLAEREKGVCFDKAWALSDIYNQLGFDSRMGNGFEKKRKDYHAWTHLRYNGISFDLDPTWYEEFKIVKRE